MGLAKKARELVPGLLIPLLAIDGSVGGYQYRPDNPRRVDGNKVIKYENPTGQPNMLDFPPGVSWAEVCADPNKELWFVEGIKKADCAVAQGIPAIGFTGVWGWKGTDFNTGARRHCPIGMTLRSTVAGWSSATTVTAP